MTDDSTTDDAAEKRQPSSAIARLPRKAALPAPAVQGEKGNPPPKPVKTKLPLKKADASTPAVQAGSAPKRRDSIFGPRFWTFAGVLSLTVNAILVVVVVVLLVVVNRMGMTVAHLVGLGNSLLELPGGLYENFEKMDRASIQTNVVVNTMIPVQFDLALNQQTNVILSEDVTITNALVTVNTGGLNISRANTTIVLPQGTTLPVFLSLTVPVDTEIPVTLNVPVDIPLSQTELNEPFVGLQEVIKPLYCGLNPSAVNLDGAPICP